VQQFDEQEAPPGLTNYWGYSPVVFFAPHRGYCSCSDPLGPMNEFRDMVRALHRAGIEVILDVVFNHTTEGDRTGPTLSFRGLEDRAYYLYEQQNPARYANYSGCGNTINANNSIVRRMIIDCLQYWVQGMHVDGFRFDLASVLARDENGFPLKNPPLLWEIESDPILAGTKIIAEAWDAAGLYQVGSFIGHRWAEWNGQYRDDIRRFVKSDPDSVPRLAARIAGSRDLYPQPDREPNRSINFITCHDGFTIHDLVSYNEKHNEANGDENLDGSNDNLSWNCGTEGDTDDRDIVSLRNRQARNLLAMLLLSQGVPMLLYGDEVMRTQGGNNNAYCQDNEVSWFDWDLTKTNSDMLRFVREMITFRRRHPCLMHKRFLHGTHDTGTTYPDVTWHGARLHEPAWGDPNAQVLAFTLGAAGSDEEDLHIVLNMSESALDMPLPDPMGRLWYCAIDTAKPSPEDIVEPGRQRSAATGQYHVSPRSVVVFERRLKPH
jgi:isoamylase